MTWFCIHPSCRDNGSRRYFAAAPGAVHGSAYLEGSGLGLPPCGRGALAAPAGPPASGLRHCHTRMKLLTQPIAQGEVRPGVRRYKHSEKAKARHPRPSPRWVLVGESTVGVPPPPRESKSDDDHDFSDSRERPIATDPHAMAGDAHFTDLSTVISGMPPSRSVTSPVLPLISRPTNLWVGGASASG
jgi:hypothetical protein